VGDRAVGGVEEGDTYLEMVSDRKSYRAGETARLVVRRRRVRRPGARHEGAQSITYTA